MRFEMAPAIEVLSRTPQVVRQMLSGLDERWIQANEGADTWSPFDIVGHLIHGDRTDWISRARRILEHGPDLPFEPFDRFAQKEASRGKTLDDLLDEFAQVRGESLAQLAALEIGADDFAREGMHPELGRVTLGQLLATWVTHDLGHIAQISRVMATQYAGEIGPWVEYIPVVRDRAK